MNPTFHDGHLLYVRPNVRDLSVGDVIVYQDPINKVNVVHRIVAVSEQGLITRGDNNPYDDPDPILIDQVVGKVDTAEDNRALRGCKVGGSVCGKQNL